ncbi:hypothetical protein GCM10009715_23360 [Paeniglutamicibacter psychrophenolicus]
MGDGAVQRVANEIQFQGATHEFRAAPFTIGGHMDQCGTSGPLKRERPESEGVAS